METLILIMVIMYYSRVIRVSHRCCKHGGGSSKFDGGDLSQNMGGSKGELKMLSKNTCERVHFIAKLPAVSLQASKLKMNFFTHIFQGF